MLERPKKSKTAVVLLLSFSLLVIVASGSSVEAGVGSKLGKMVRDLLLPNRQAERIWDLSDLSDRVASGFFGTAPYSTIDLAKHGKIPNSRSAIGDLDEEQIFWVLRSLEFRSELRGVIGRSLPNDVPISREIEQQALKAVEDVVNPIILDVLRKRPEIANEIWTNFANPSDLRFISEELEKSFATLGHKEISTKLTVSPTAVHLAFPRGVQLGSVELKVGEIELIKPTILAAGVAWCVFNEENCTDDIMALLPSRPRELSENADKIGDTVTGGIGGIQEPQIP